MSFPLLAVTLALLAAPIFATPVLAAPDHLASPPQSTRYLAENWEVRHGLPAVTVTDITQDADGFLWVATLGGLTRFDGREFVPADAKALDADGHRVFTVEALGDFVFVTTTLGHVFRLNRRGGEATKIGHPASPIPQKFLRLAKDQNGALLLLADNVWRWEPDRDAWERAIALDNDWARDIFFHDDGQVWLMGENRIWCAQGPCQDIPSFERVGLLSASPVFVENESAPNAAPKWWVTSDKGLEVLTVGDKKWEASAPPLKVGPPATSMRTEDGRFFVATPQHLFSFGPKGMPPTEIVLPLQRPELPTITMPMATVYFEDRDNNIWLGSGNLGLFLLHDRHIERVGAAQGLQGRSTLSIAATDSGALVSTYCVGPQRLVLGSEATPNTVVPIFGRAFNEKTCVNGMLVGANGALLALDKDIAFVAKDSTKATMALEGATRNLSSALAFYPTDDGGFWAGTASSGLVHILPRKSATAAPGKPIVTAPLPLMGETPQRERPWKTLEVAPQYTVNQQFPFADISIATIAADASGDLYLGTSKGVRRFDGAKLTELSPPATKQAVPIRHIVFDTKGNLWAPSYGSGILYVPANELEGPKRAISKARWLRRETGFCTDFVSHMHVTGERQNARVWFNSNAGVFWVLASELQHHIQKQTPLRCRFLDTGEGNGGASPTAASLSDGRLLFPTVKGPVLIAPDAIAETAIDQPGRPWVESARIDGAPIAMAGETSFPPGNRDLTLDLLYPQFSGPQLSTFEVTLTRDRDPPRRVVGGRRPFFSQLSPGHYALAIRHIRADGARSDAQRLHFVLEPAWHERKLFQVGVPLGVLSILAALVWTWVSILRARAQLLTSKLKEREAKEHARRERDELYMAAFERSRLPLLVFARGGRLVDANKAAEAYTQAVPEQEDEVALGHISGVERERFVRCIHALADNDDDSSKKPASTAREFVLVSETGERTVQVAAVPFALEGSRRMLVTLIDLTNERLAEKDRSRLARRTEATKRLEGLGRISAGIAHDFNNVLAALALQIQLLPMETEEDREVVSEMRESIDWGQALTARLLTGKGRSEALPLVFDTTVSAIMAAYPLNATAKPRVQTSCDAAGAQVAVTDVELKQVITNLVDNACQAVLKTGAIDVRTACSSSPEDLVPNAEIYGEGVVVHPFPEGELVAVSVTDNGPGIELPLIASIFEPFFSKKLAKGGTGIGLTTVLEIVRARGGGLCVHSRPGVGVCFVVAFPRVVESAPLAKQVPQPRAQPLPFSAASQPTDDNPLVTFREPAPTILICDDQETIRRGLTLALTRAGADVINAQDGAEGLALFRERFLDIDLVVTDYRMPNMDGLTLITHIRAIDAAFPILLLSGFLGDAEVLDRLPADVSRLQKPVDPFALVVEVRAVLDARKSANTKGEDAT